MQSPSQQCSTGITRLDAAITQVHGLMAKQDGNRSAAIAAVTAMHGGGFRTYFSGISTVPSVDLGVYGLDGAYIETIVDHSTCPVQMIIPQSVVNTFTFKPQPIDVSTRSIGSVITRQMLVLSALFLLIVLTVSIGQAFTADTERWKYSDDGYDQGLLPQAFSFISNVYKNVTHNIGNVLYYPIKSLFDRFSKKNIEL